jgi:hypothetical protein
MVGSIAETARLEKGEDSSEETASNVRINGFGRKVSILQSSR